MLVTLARVLWVGEVGVRGVGRVGAVRDGVHIPPGKILALMSSDQMYKCRGLNSANWIVCSG